MSNNRQNVSSNTLELLSIHLAMKCIWIFFFLSLSLHNHSHPNRHRQGLPNVCNLYFGHWSSYCLYRWLCLSLRLFYWPEGLGDSHCLCGFGYQCSRYVEATRRRRAWGWQTGDCNSHLLGNYSSDGYGYTKSVSHVTTRAWVWLHIHRSVEVVSKVDFKSPVFSL